MMFMKKHILITTMSLLISTTVFAEESPLSNKPTEPAKQTPPPAAATAEVTSLTSSSTIGGYVGLGLPHAVNVGLEYFNRPTHWSFAIDFAGFRYKPKDDDADKEEVSLGSFALEARYHPDWDSAFYWAAAIGAQTVKAKKTATYSGETVSPEAKISNSYITPKAGWIWHFRSGFNMGFELGAQIPLSNKVDLDDGTTNPLVLNNPDYIKNKNDAKDLADTFGKMVLPYAVFRVGLEF